MRPAGLSSSPAPATSRTERQGTIVGELLLSFSPLQTDGETEAFSLLLPFGEASLSSAIWGTWEGGSKGTARLNEISFTPFVKQLSRSWARPALCRNEHKAASAPQEALGLGCFSIWRWKLRTEDRRSHSQGLTPALLLKSCVTWEKALDLLNLSFLICKMDFLTS